MSIASSRERRVIRKPISFEAKPKPTVTMNTRGSLKDKKKDQPLIKSSRIRKPIKLDMDKSSEDEYKRNVVVNKKRNRRQTKKVEIVEEEELYEYDDEDVIECILGVKDEEGSLIRNDDFDVNDAKASEYYVKFKGKAHIHCKWMNYQDIVSKEGGEGALKNFERKIKRSMSDLSLSMSVENLKIVEDDEINPAWLEVDRIIDERGEEGGEATEYLVKWRQLDYSKCTWEKVEDIPDKNAIEIYNRRMEHSNPIKIPSNYQIPDPNNFAPLEEPVVNKRGEELRSYQMEGLNWLRYCWYNRNSNILADEMGLGKTAQSINMINYLAKVENIRGPHLVVVPLSTLEHWYQEFQLWTDLNVVVYHGDQEALKLIYKTEFTVLNSKGAIDPTRVQFDVLVTSYEKVYQEFKLFESIHWRYVVFDEAQKLKNPYGKKYQKVEHLIFEHCTLLTGTPIQNDTKELWALLHLIHPSRFDDLEEFMNKYGDIKDNKQVEELQNILKPLMLRRKKSDVEKSIAPKEETIVFVELTRIQKTYYRAFLSDNASILLSQLTNGATNSLTNLVMQLRKVCNHPYLIKGAEEDIRREAASNDKYKGMSETEIDLHSLVDSSGKVVFLDKLLPRLKQQGSKVLIFSQMVKILDIIQRYLELKDYKFERLDGSCENNQRAASIDRFKNDPEKFVFLLSTRAAGTGLNLTNANTVILFDLDWNPQNDIQAEARCHRIGQTQKVKVYRLITSNTYEYKMYEKASRKLGLDYVLLEGGDARNEKQMKPKEIEEMLRNGISSLFNDDDTEADQFTAADIDQILERNSKTTVQDIITGGDSTFSRASFNADSNNIDMNMDNKDFWAHFLPKKNPDEQPSQRRCRQNTDLETSDVWRSINSLKRTGIQGNPQELPVLAEAYGFVKNLLSINDQNLVERILGDVLNRNRNFSKYSSRIEQEARKIVQRTLLFYKLVRVMKFIQGPIDEWPFITPQWETPVQEYALMLGIFKHGFGSSFEAVLNDRDLHLDSVQPISKTAIESRVNSIILHFEQKHPEILLLEIEEGFKPAIPGDWVKAHKNIVIRDYLNETELTNLLNTINSLGIPMKGDSPDLEKLIKHSKIDVVSNETFLDFIQQLRDIAANINSMTATPDDELDLSSYSLFKAVDRKLSIKEVRKFVSAIVDMESFTACAELLNSNPSAIDIAKSKFRTFKSGPDWWDYEYDVDLVKALALYGIDLVTSFICDKNFKFRSHIKSEYIENFEKKAKLESEKHRLYKPDKTEDFTGLYNKTIRISRCRAVVQTILSSINKNNSKDNRPSRRKSSDLTKYTVIDYGKIVTNPKFYRKNVVFPDGYTCLHRYRVNSYKDSEFRVYRCEIHDIEEKPMFTITDTENKTKYEGTDIQEVCNQLSEALKTEYKENKAIKIQGTVFFGLTDKDIFTKLSELDDAYRLTCFTKAYSDMIQKIEFTIPLHFLSDTEAENGE